MFSLLRVYFPTTTATNCLRSLIQIVSRWRLHVLTNKSFILCQKFSVLTQSMNVCRKSSLRYTKAFSTKLCRMVLRKCTTKGRENGKGENATLRKSLNAWKLDWRNQEELLGWFKLTYSLCSNFYLISPHITHARSHLGDTCWKNR